MNRRPSSSTSSRNLLVGSLAFAFLLCAVAECASQAAAPDAVLAPVTPTQSPLWECPPIAAPTAEDHVRTAFRESEPETRTVAVLCSMKRFLRAAAVREMDDDQASRYLTEIAFASERLTLSDPAVLARDGARAVIGLPDGMGLYFYDLSPQGGAVPLTITPWTVGLRSLQVSWDTYEVGVGFETVGSDGVSLMRYALLITRGDAWEVAWLGDDQADWWFNAHNATLTIAPDRSRLVLTGEALSSTLVFAEAPGSLSRVFRLEWEREGNTYRLLLPPSGYPSRQAWAWNVAEPGPYATLVEFVERMVMNDADGAAKLVTHPDVIADATAYGFYLPGRQFEVLSNEARRIVFRDRQGTFVADFRTELSEEGTVWKISSLAPLGAEP